MVSLSARSGPKEKRARQKAWGFFADAFADSSLSDWFHYTAIPCSSYLNNLDLASEYFNGSSFLPIALY